MMGLKDVGDRLRAELVKHHISFPGVDDMDYIFDLYKAIPYWVESSEFNPPPEYDLWAINWKTPYVANDGGNLTGNPWLAEIYAKDPWEAVILVNPATAERKKLKDGDIVVVESRYGRLEGRLRVSELFHPDTVGVGGSYGLGTLQSNPLNRLGPNFNALLSLDDKTFDGVSGGQDTAPAVKVYGKEGGR
jgi:anaerobic selenocysteine-containing dehydrogenase